MRFVVDGMLGTLAKWLRILGYDTLLDPALDDHQLVRLARAEDRVLLTRDRELARRPGLRVLLVSGEQLDDQIRQVRRELAPPAAEAFSRCPVCNQVLQPMEAEAAQARVPAYVAQTQQTFRACPVCRRIYWHGTHRLRMEERMTQIIDGG